MLPLQADLSLCISFFTVRDLGHLQSANTRESTKHQTFYVKLPTSYKTDVWRFPGAGVTQVCIDMEHFETDITQVRKNTLIIISKFRAG